MDKPWIVYLLLEENSSRTYIGATTNIDRRLRQHNGQIKGGARSTKGKKWKLVCYLQGFRNRSEAYRWEKLLKLRSGRGIKNREKAFNKVSKGECPPGRRSYEVPTYLKFYGVTYE